MAKHKYEFRPDKTGSGLLSKLYLTKKQRLSLLKWTLYGIVLLILSVLQDVILCHFRLFGATTDLLPCAILLICIYQGIETGSIFALVAAALYQFSGTAPGYYIIALITALGMIACGFRQGYLQKSMSADLLCTGVALGLYELIIYLVAVVSGVSSWERGLTVLLTATLSALCMPILYPVTTLIDRIGGEAWKE